MIAGPSPQFLAVEMQQLQAVVAAAMPGDVIVVTLPSTVPPRAVYAVEKGDTLTSIARAFGISVEALEAENPQLTALGHRDPNLIYVGELVNIPRSQPSRQARGLVIAHAPDGPPRPNLLELPPPPRNATPFEMAQWSKEVEAVRQQNAETRADWLAAVARQLQPWKVATKALLQRVAADPTIASELAGGVDLAATIREAATTLHGLPGHRVLVLAPGETAVPSMAGLSGIQVVVADLDDPSRASAWASAATSGGAAKVTVQTPELSALGLQAAVAGTQNTEGKQ